jgi:hypothetical protein
MPTSSSGIGLPLRSPALFSTAPRYRSRVRGLLARGTPPTLPTDELDLNLTR